MKAFGNLTSDDPAKLCQCLKPGDLQGLFGQLTGRKTSSISLMSSARFVPDISKEPLQEGTWGSAQDE